MVEKKKKFFRTRFRVVSLYVAAYFLLILGIMIINGNIDSILDLLNPRYFVLTFLMILPSNLEELMTYLILALLVFYVSREIVKRN